MCSKRLGPRGEVGDTVVFERLIVSPTPSRGWDRVGTTEEVGTDRCSDESAKAQTLKGRLGAYSVEEHAVDPGTRCCFNPGIGREERR